MRICVLYYSLLEHKAVGAQVSSRLEGVLEPTRSATGKAFNVALMVTATARLQRCSDCFDSDGLGALAPGAPGEALALMGASRSKRTRGKRAAKASRTKKASRLQALGLEMSSCCEVKVYCSR